MPDAILYHRYSDRPKGAKIPDCESLQTQEAINRAYCQREGLEPKRIINDPQTSARAHALSKRNGGAELLDLAPRVGRIVCYSLSRLFRDVADGTITLRKWRKERVIVYSATQGIFDTSTPNGRLQVGIQLLFDEYEADNSASRTRDAMRRHVMSGRVMGGTAKYGWEPDPEKPGRVRKSESEYPTLLEMLRLAEIDPSPALIATTLNAAGYVNRDGKPWHRESIKRIIARPLVAR